MKTISSSSIDKNFHVIVEIEASDDREETLQVFQHWREIVKPDIQRPSNGRWTKYQEPRFLRNERKVIEEQLRPGIEI